MNPFKEIAPSAVSHFDALGLQLLARVTRRIPKRRTVKSPEPDWSPRTIPDLVIDGKKLAGVARVERVDAYTQKEDRVEWTEGDGFCTLHGDGLKTLQEMSDGLKRLKPIGRILHESTIRTYVLEWISACRSLAASLDAVAYVCDRIDREIKELEVLVPISELVVQRNLKFADIELVPFDATVFQLWKASLVKIYGINEQEAELRLTRVKEIAGRGHGALRFVGLGDALLVEERAHALASEVCGLVRFFWEGNLALGSRCYVQPYGLEPLSQRVTFRSVEGGHYGYNAQLACPPPEPLALTDKEMPHLLEKGWQELFELFALRQKTDFQNKLLAALAIYTKNCLSFIPLERVIAIVVALESMLVRDSWEPIQANLGFRLALIVESDVKRRRRVIEAVKKCYDMRSKYMHHGELPSESAEHIETLLVTAWKFFYICIRNNTRITSVNHFFEAIESSRLSAPSVNLSGG